MCVVVVVSHIQRVGCQPEKTTLHGGQSRAWSAERGKENQERKSVCVRVLNCARVCFLFCLYLTSDRWASTCLITNPTYCNVAILLMPVVTKDLPISPRFPPYEFSWRCKFSTLTTRQPMVKFYLLMFARFPLRKPENTCSVFHKNRAHDFRTVVEGVRGFLLLSSYDVQRVTGTNAVYFRSSEFVEVSVQRKFGCTTLGVRVVVVVVVSHIQRIGCRPKRA